MSKSIFKQYAKEDKEIFLLELTKFNESLNNTDVMEYDKFIKCIEDILIGMGYKHFTSDRYGSYTSKEPFGYMHIKNSRTVSTVTIRCQLINDNDNIRMQFYTVEDINSKSLFYDTKEIIFNTKKYVTVKVTKG